jgi:hypothetical protein
MNRRQLIKAGVGMGALAAGGAMARYALLSPPPLVATPIDALAAQVHSGLSATARKQACFALDHPLRQVHNRGLWLGGVNVNAFSLSWDARRALSTLLRQQLSAEGFERLLSQYPSRISGVNYLNLLMFGTPGEGPWQMLLSGIHLNLRVGSQISDSAAFGGTAFGGPVVYGDQRGNERDGLPGNVFRYQMQAAHQLIAGLTPAQRGAIRVTQAPPQTCIAVQGRDGRFDGLPVAELPLESRKLAHTVVAGILENYGEANAAHALECLNRNGGVDALHFADYDVDYQGGRHAGDKPSQVFRLEGAGAVFHFRGQPHVHAFVNVERDVDQPLSLGDVLGTNPAALEGQTLRTWFETAMREQAQADFAYYPGSSLAGRLRAGTLRTGDVWAAESWVDDLVVCEVKGADIPPGFGRFMSSRGKPPQAQSTYRIATTGYMAASGDESRFGRASASRNLGLLRNALVTQASRHGFGA